MSEFATKADAEQAVEYAEQRHAEAVHLAAWHRAHGWGEAHALEAERVAKRYAKHVKHIRAVFSSLSA